MLLHGPQIQTLLRRKVFSLHMDLHQASRRPRLFPSCMLHRAFIQLPSNLHRQSLLTTLGRCWHVAALICPIGCIELYDGWFLIKGMEFHRLWRFTGTGITLWQAGTRTLPRTGSATTTSLMPFLPARSLSSGSGAASSPSCVLARLSLTHFPCRWHPDSPHAPH